MNGFSCYEFSGRQVELFDSTRSKKKTITNDILKNHGGGTTMIGNIHHSSRTISNMERSLAFYHDLLGF